jgi:glycosyltransferase involved in cell wall biosynthesis
MNILFLTDNFYPEVNAPASRTFENCKEWVKLGHNITVLTGFPNYPHGVVYSGYKNKLYQSEIVDGIKVIRIWTYMAQNQGVIKRILDYLSFMFMAILASIFVRKIDIVIGTSPQFFTACSAWFVSRVKRIPFIFEVRDLWPASIEALEGLKNQRILSLLSKIEYFLYAQAHMVIVVTQSFKEILSKNGVNSDKIHVITNGVDRNLFYKRSKNFGLMQKYELKGKKIVGYIGTHGIAHNLQNILHSAFIIQKRFEGSPIIFIFIGEGAEKNHLKIKSEELCLNNVIFIDNVAKNIVPDYWSLLDISIISLRDVALFKTVLPSKVFECMGMGLPILSCVSGECAELIKNYDIGRYYNPNQPDKLANEIVKMLNDTSELERLEANSSIAAKDFDRSKLARQMIEEILVSVG